MRGIPGRKLNRPMRFAAALLLFLLLSAHSIAGLYASYASSFSGGDGARVAKFEVTAFVLEGQETNFSLSPDNTTAVYSFSVTSDSEVSVVYDVILDFHADLPEGVAVTLDGKAPTDVSGGVYTFSPAGTFVAGNATNGHSLRIVVSLFEQNATLNNISVKVVASQAN